jgi:integrase
MASIFKRTRNGKQAKKYTIGYRDGNGKWKEIAGSADFAMTKRMASQFEADALLRRRGVLPPDADPLVLSEQEPIEHHRMDYLSYLEGKADTDKYVDQVGSYILSVCQACGFKTLGSINTAKLMSHAGDLRQAGAGTVAINRRLAAMKGFAKWLFENERTRKHRLVGVKMINARTDRRHQRRVLSEEELTKVFAASEGSQQTVMCLSGPERALYYRIATETGFRAAEIASLTPLDFDLSDLENASVTVTAAYSKHRKQDVQPIRRDLAERLGAFIVGKPLMEPIFKKPDKPVKMLKVDLAAAGIPYKDEAGRYCDFHALRHTFISRLARAGVSPAIAKELARHSTITLTIDYYTHVQEERRAALAKLPPVA